eukprot:234231_1
MDLMEQIKATQNRQKSNEKPRPNASFSSLDKHEHKIEIRKIKMEQLQFPMKQSKGKKVSASEGPCPYQIKRWSMIINHWKRQNKINKNSDDINQIVIDFICHSLYRLVKLPKTVTAQNAFDPKTKLKSSVYWTEKEFIYEFVNNEKLKEDNTYKLFVKSIPKINFDRECLLILHLEIPVGASIDLKHLRTSLHTAYIRSGVIKFSIESRGGWQELYESRLYKYYVLCIVMSKALNIKTVEIDGCMSWFEIL